MKVKKIQKQDHTAEFKVLSVRRVKDALAIGAVAKGAIFKYVVQDTY